MGVCAVIILFKPDYILTGEVIRHSIDQVDQLFILDNTLPEDVNATLQREHIPLSQKIVYHSFGANMGIAAAQNFGIELARKEQLDFILFLDQDSVIEDGTVSKLLQVHEELVAQGFKVGAVGPSVYSRETGVVYKAKIDKGHKVMEDVVAIGQLISSGSFIKVAVFEEVGLMEDGLFIDAVDFEWCWRARVHGYSHFLTDRVKIEHMFGEQERKLAGVKMSVPSPFRCFFLYRNYLLLLRRSYVPVYWKVSNGIKFFIKFFYYGFYLDKRSQYRNSIFRGIKQGLKGKY